MDREQPRRMKGRTGWIVPLLLIFALVGGALYWSQQRAEERARQEQVARAEGIARVLSATFSKQSKLQVGELNGALDVTSVDPGFMELFRSAQRVTLPYSVTYTVDLSGMDLDRFRWDEASRTLTVEAPDVVASPPNVDETKRAVRETTGLWVSRGAAENLSRRAAVLAGEAAAKRAASPQEMAKARDNARTALARLIETPLAAADMGDVRVVVRFPQDGTQDRERWDVSPSIEEVLNRNREARQAQ